MITLKKDRELVYLERWSELEEMAGFSSSLDPSITELQEIIGRYKGEHGTVKCGLKSCQTPHSKGYIISTQSGNITNIGHVCGKKYFGVDFETMSNKLDMDFDDKENRELIDKFSDTDLPSLQDWIKEKQKISSSINKGLNPIRYGRAGEKIPKIIQSTIFHMQKNKTAQLTIERELTQSERELAETSNNSNRNQFKTEIVGIIKGIECLYPENDLNILLKQLKEEIEIFLNLNPSNLTHKELKRWVKWIRETPITKQKIENSILYAQLFLTYENLSTFYKILNDEKDKNIWKSFLTPFEALSKLQHQ